MIDVAHIRTSAQTGVIQIAPDPTIWDSTRRSWVRRLRAKGLSQGTIKIYLEALDLLGRWCMTDGLNDPSALTTEDIEDYLDWALNRTTPKGTKVKRGTVARDFRALKQFFKYLATRDDPNGVSIMALLTEPHVPAVPVPILEDDQIGKLLRVCKGKSFAERRDTAIIRLLADTGIRRAEIAALTTATTGNDSIDLENQMITVVGKRGKVRSVPIMDKTAEALDDYLRARAAHRFAKRKEFWLAAPPYRSQTLGYDGIKLMIYRRAKQAGIEGVFAHQFRHTATDAFLARGGQEGDAMELFGWSSREMLDRYGRSARHRRAVAAARQINAADRF